jgi:hypothetical protein
MYNDFLTITTTTQGKIMEDENELKELVNDCLEQICSTNEFSAYVNLGKVFITDETDQVGEKTGRRFYDAERHRKAYLTMKLDYESLFYDVQAESAGEQKINADFDPEPET